jgi:hypothetical protein
LRDEYCRGLKSVRIDADGTKPAFDADGAWRDLGLLAGKYFSDESLMREFMRPAWKGTNRKKRLHNIAGALEQAQDMISEALKSELGNELFLR